MANALEPELSNLERNFLELCQLVVSACDLELYDFNYNPGSSLLQVFIVNPQTGTALIEDCVKVDRGFDEYMEQPWLPANLTLEVSSPGVYRSLVTKAHFESALDQPVQLTLKKRFEEIAGEANCPKKLKGQRKVKVVLVSQNDESLTVKYNDQTFAISFEDIKKANLEID